VERVEKALVGEHLPSLPDLQFVCRVASSGGPEIGWNVEGQAFMERRGSCMVISAVICNAIENEWPHASPQTRGQMLISFFANVLLQVVRDESLLKLREELFEWFARHFTELHEHREKERVLLKVAKEEEDEEGLATFVMRLLENVEDVETILNMLFEDHPSLTGVLLQQERLSKTMNGHIKAVLEKALETNDLGTLVALSNFIFENLNLDEEEPRFWSAISHGLVEGVESMEFSRALHVLEIGLEIDSTKCQSRFWKILLSCFQYLYEMDLTELKNTSMEIWKCMEACDLNSDLEWNFLKLLLEKCLRNRNPQFANAILFELCSRGVDFVRWDDEFLDGVLFSGEVISEFLGSAERLDEVATFIYQLSSRRSSSQCLLKLALEQLRFSERIPLAVRLLESIDGKAFELDVRLREIFLKSCEPLKCNCRVPFLASMQQRALDSCSRLLCEMQPACDVTLLAQLVQFLPRTAVIPISWNLNFDSHGMLREDPDLFLTILEREENPGRTIELAKAFFSFWKEELQTQEKALWLRSRMLRLLEVRTVTDFYLFKSPDVLELIAVAENQRVSEFFSALLSKSQDGFQDLEIRVLDSMRRCDIESTNPALGSAHNEVLSRIISRKAEGSLQCDAEAFHEALQVRNHRPFVIVSVLFGIVGAQNEFLVPDELTDFLQELLELECEPEPGLDISSMHIIQLIALKFVDEAAYRHPDWAFNVLQRWLNPALSSVGSKSIWRGIVVLGRNVASTPKEKRRELVLQILGRGEFEELKFNSMKRSRIEQLITLLVTDDGLWMWATILDQFEDEAVDIEKSITLAIILINLLGLFMNSDFQALAKAQRIHLRTVILCLPLVTSRSVLVRESSSFIIWTLFRDTTWHLEAEMSGMPELNAHISALCRFLEENKVGMQNMKKASDKLSRRNPYQASKLEAFCQEALTAVQRLWLEPWLMEKDFRVSETDSCELELPSLKPKEPERLPCILLANHVSKVPNVAGLFRTSEFLGLETIVIQMSKTLADRGFGSIAKSAHTWMPHQVLPVSETEEYIKRLKHDGCLIVALEQTAKSIPVQRYVFPKNKKICVLLGMEKQGTPGYLLRQVDVCIEIPQFGITRSLNVHASAAVLLWTYWKQVDP